MDGALSPAEWIRDAAFPGGVSLKKWGPHPGSGSCPWALGSSWGSQAAGHWWRPPNGNTSSSPGGGGGKEFHPVTLQGAD